MTQLEGVVKEHCTTATTHPILNHSRYSPCMSIQFQTMYIHIQCMPHEYCTPPPAILKMYLKNIILLIQMLNIKIKTNVFLLGDEIH